MGFAAACLLIAVPALAQTAQPFVFHLDGSQLVPGVSTAARGGCFMEFEASTSELAFTCVHDAGGTTGAHIGR